MDKDSLYDGKKNNPVIDRASSSILSIAKEVGLDTKKLGLLYSENNNGIKESEIISVLEEKNIFILPKGELEDYIGRGEKKEVNALKFCNKINAKEVPEDFRKIIKIIDARIETLKRNNFISS